MTICAKGSVMSVTDKIIVIIAEQAVLETSDVTLESTLEDLGIDSLGLVESIFAIEEEFDITVPFNANEPSNSDFDISSVSKIIEGVTRLVKEQAT
jgi:acyl carrier protein